MTQETRANLTTRIAYKRERLYERHMHNLAVEDAVDASELIKDICKLWHEREMIKLEEEDKQND